MRSYFSEKFKNVIAKIKYIITPPMPFVNKINASIVEVLINNGVTKLAIKKAFAISRKNSENSL